MATKGPISPIIDPMIDPRTGEYAVIAPGHNFRVGDAEDRWHRADGQIRRWHGSLVSIVAAGIAQGVHRSASRGSVLKGESASGV